MSNKILFHICCGPCATATIKKLKQEGYIVIGYYYNPNIHPASEYKKRLNEAKKLTKKESFELLIEDYDEGEYFERVKGLESNKAERCPNCWELRLERTVKKAKELGIKEFGSTLRISPYQNQEQLLEIGKRLAKKYELNFYDPSLISCFHDSVALSKEQGMYRQKYCGCIFSKEYR